ncbi:MAG: M20/M25/M40 family metallo-hydrolase [Bacteroidales bacterium]|nr:M20/M25/M40 family metallo-hydrolase [Candidatus Sodaliphilus aphodohippi]
MTDNDCIELLKRLVACPSTSRNEDGTADIIEDFLCSQGVDNVVRLHSNVYARSAVWNDALPVLLLNSHHDTVKPSASWTRDPFSPDIVDGRLYGLGSNDAGASVVCLIAAFLHYYRIALPFNIILAISAEEEVTGEHGIRALLPQLGRIDMAVVGEPTMLQAALGERGLVVLDCVSHGKRGHAARAEGVNALYKALDDINTLRKYRQQRISQLLGPMSITTTQIQAGTQHNIIPDECRWVVDVRTTDAYTNEETVELIRSLISSEATPRSTRIRASAISSDHPLVKAAVAMGAPTMVSPATSDMSQMQFPSLKIGVGDSARSHSADEFICLDEISQGRQFYINYINTLAQTIAAGE